VVLEFRFKGKGLMVTGLGLRISSFRFKIYGQGFRV
jgi:hypothetical protein